MKIPVKNRSQVEIVIGLEPEGLSLPVQPGQSLLITCDRGDGRLLDEVFVEVFDGQISI